jgi:epoxyqueuosine reductase
MDDAMIILKESIRSKALELGFCAVGFAAARPQTLAVERLSQMTREGRHGEMHYLETGMKEREDPSLVLNGAATVISTAIAYPERQIDDEFKGTISAHALIPDYHRIVRGLLEELLEFICTQVPGPVNGMVCIDSAPMLEKAWADASGIGRPGKNTLLIVPGAGSRVFLGELLLDIALEPDTVLAWDSCSTCTSCIDSCPTGALTKTGRLDASRCISYLTIELKRDFTVKEASMINDWLYGCDLCLEACPHNNQNHSNPHPVFRPIKAIENLTAESALELTSSGFRKLFAGTPVVRIGLGRLKRNARAVLKNRTARAEKR